MNPSSKPGFTNVYVSNVKRSGRFAKAKDAQNKVNFGSSNFKLTQNFGCFFNHIYQYIFAYFRTSKFHNISCPVGMKVMAVAWKKARIWMGSVT